MQLAMPRYGQKTERSRDEQMNDHCEKAMYMYNTQRIELA